MNGEYKFDQVNAPIAPATKIYWVREFLGNVDTDNDGVLDAITDINGDTIRDWAQGFTYSTGSGAIAGGASLVYQPPKWLPSTTLRS